MKRYFIFLMLFSTLSFSSEIKRILLNSNNTIHLLGEINSRSMSKVILQAIDKDLRLDRDSPLYLVINSPGGEIFAGLEGINALLGLNRDIKIIVVNAASMAFIISQFFGERLALDNSLLMSHRASGGLSGDFGGTLDSRMSYMKDILEAIDVAVVSRTNGKLSLEDYKQLYANELWMSTSRAISLGFVDNRVRIKCDQSLMTSSKVQFDTLFGPVYVEFSNCPLITEPLKVSTNIENSVDYSPLSTLEFLRKLLIILR